MRYALMNVILAFGFGCLASGVMIGLMGSPPVMLALPHTAYSLPPCPTEDHGLPGGCVWQSSEGDTFVIYTPGRT